MIAKIFVAVTDMIADKRFLVVAIPFVIGITWFLMEP